MTWTVRMPARFSISATSVAPVMSSAITPSSIGQLSQSRLDPRPAPHQPLLAEMMHVARRAMPGSRRADAWRRACIGGRHA